MKKLKRYQYERYAILCQLAYPDAERHYQDTLIPFNQRILVDTNGRKSVRILWQDSRKEVIVVFRGSLGTKDWLGNFCCILSNIKQHSVSYRVHWGFKRLLFEPMNILEKSDEAPQPLRALIEETLTPLQAQGRRFSFIGHSSGGALAVFMADYFERKYPKSVKRVVTFGQPAAGGKGFYSKYLLNKKTYRICCDLDVVTFLPPFPLPFYHVGRLLWLHDDQIYENTHTLKRLTMSLKSWILRPVTYHFMRKYIRNKSLFDEH